VSELAPLIYPLTIYFFFHHPNFHSLRAITRELSAASKNDSGSSLDENMKRAEIEKKLKRSN
jgi:hypothetical protein